MQGGMPERADALPLVQCQILQGIPENCDVASYSEGPQDRHGRDAGSGYRAIREDRGEGTERTDSRRTGEEPAMTPCERLALQALAHVSLGCFNGTKRFITDVLAKPDDYELTPRQKWNVARLAWMYRKQVPRSISDWALETNAGRMPPPPIPRPSRRKPKPEATAPLFQS